MPTNKEKNKPNFEAALLKDHKIKASVNQIKEGKEHYKNRITVGNKEVFIEDKMKKGLTQVAYLHINGEVKQFKSYYEAEQVALEYLKG